MRYLVTAPLHLLLVGCPRGDDVSADATTEPAMMTAGSQDADVTGADDATGAEPAGCVDAYHGNQSAGAAFDLGLSTTETALIHLGNGVPSLPAEQGDDTLIVCDGQPSDFFSFDAACAGYVVVEARAVMGNVPDLIVTNPGGEVVGQAIGSWWDFGLKPIQRAVDAGPHRIEVRHSTPGEAQAYTVTVAVLPTAPCS